MKINEKKPNTLTAIFVVICGAFISLGLLLDETNFILAFGLLLIALVVHRSAKK